MTRDFAEEHQEKLFALLLVLAEREKQMLESKTSGLASEKQTRAAEIVRLKAQSQGICQSTSSTSAFLEFRKPQTPLDAQQRLNSLQANFRYRSACHSLLSGIQTIIQKHSSEILSLDKEREALLPPIQRQTAKISVLTAKKREIRRKRKTAYESFELTDREEALAFSQQRTSRNS